MKKLLCLLVFGICIGNIFTQTTTLYTENFNAAGHSFDLNSSSLSGTMIANKWIVNNSYIGGSGSIICFGFPFTFTVGNTSAQPAGITGAPNSNYMHILSNAAESSGITNCNFVAADGLCTFAESNFTEMNVDVNTLTYDTVKLSFWYICGGSALQYGEVHYSTNGGSTWTQITTPISNYSGATNWTRQTIALTSFNHATVRFAFRFVNNDGGSPIDPGFGIDDINIVGVTNAAGSNSISAGTLITNSYCENANLNVPYTITGTYAIGNTFTAQLSNAAGSFASPTTIGSLVSTASGSISCVIPSGTPSGTGYQIRIVSSTPSVTSDTIGPIFITNVNATATGPTTVCAGATVNLSSSGGTNYNWSGPGGFSSTLQSPVISAISIGGSGSYIVTVIDANGCSDTASVMVNVINCNSIENNNQINVSVYPNPVANYINFQSDIDFENITILDLSGKVVLKQKYQSTIDASVLSKGVYLIQLSSSSIRKTIKIVKN